MKLIDGVASFLGGIDLGSDKVETTKYECLIVPDSSILKYVTSLISWTLG